MSVFSVTDTATITALSEALTRAGVEGLEITTPGGHLRIMVSTGGTAEISRSTTTSGNHAGTVVIKAPIAGHFRPAAVDVGGEARAIVKGENLGFIAIGPILIPLIASHTGLLRSRLVEPETLVGFATPMFEIQKTS